MAAPLSDSSRSEYVRIIRMMAVVVLISVHQVKRQVTQIKSVIIAKQGVISHPHINFTLR
jgi:hypothetical protein